PDPSTSPENPHVVVGTAGDDARQQRCVDIGAETPAGQVRLFGNFTCESRMACVDAGIDQRDLYIPSGDRAVQLVGANQLGTILKFADGLAVGFFYGFLAALGGE